MEVRTPSVPMWMQEAVSSMPSYGTVTSRDSMYLPPETTDEVAALANQNAMWFNTDYGWLESYYAPVGTTGLTVRGLKAGTDAGWYPVQDGPRAVIYAADTTGQSFTSAGNFTRWSPFGSGMSFRNGDSTHISFLGSNRLIARIAGRYKASGVMHYPNGSGTGVFSLRAHTGADVPIAMVQKPVPMLAGYGQVQEFNMEEVELSKDSFIFMRSDAGSWTIGTSIMTHMSLKYVGPLLVTG